MGSVVRAGSLGAALLLTAVSLAGGALYLVGQLTVDGGGTAMRIGVGLALIIAGMAMAAGIRLNRQPEHGGGGLIAAVCFWWTGVVPLVAVSVAVSGIRRVRRQARAHKDAVIMPTRPTTAVLVALGLIAVAATACSSSNTARAELKDATGSASMT